MDVTVVPQRKIEVFDIHSFMFEVHLGDYGLQNVELYVEYEVYKKNLNKTHYTVWATTSKRKFRGNIFNGVIDVPFNDSEIIEAILRDTQKSDELAEEIIEFLHAFED